MKKFGLVVIGAHFGVWLNDELSRFDKENILLVEPVPYNYNKLKERFVPSFKVSKLLKDRVNKALLRGF